MAYLLLLRLQAQHIPEDRPWSAFQLQRQFTWEVLQEQCERSARQWASKWLQMGKQLDNIQPPVTFVAAVLEHLK